MAFDLVVFNKQVYIATTELVAQQVQLFNAASAGAITLASISDNMGDFAMEASFKQIAGLVRRRDVYNGSNDVASVRLTHLQNNTVKVPSGTPPVDFEQAQYNWILQNPALAASMIGQQLAVATLQDMLNTAISAAVAAISAETSVNYAASGTLAFGDLVRGAGKFGDRQGALAAWVMHSKSMTDLWANAVTNNEKLFVYGTVSVLRDPFGRLFVMTDSDSLVATTTTSDEPPVTTTKYKVLGLVPGAIMVEQNPDFDSYMQRSTGKENIQNSYQAEWSYNLGLYGYSWDITAGGKAPTNASIATSANWERTSTDIKDTAGVLITAS